MFDYIVTGFILVAVFSYAAVMALTHAALDRWNFPGKVESRRERE